MSPEHRRLAAILGVEVGGHTSQLARGAADHKHFSVSRCFVVGLTDPSAAEPLR